MQIESTIRSNSNPGFGIPIGNPHQMEWSDLLKKISGVAFAILIGAGVGFLLGGIPGAIIGAAVATGVTLSCIGIHFIRSKLLAHRYQIAFPPSTHVESPEVPQLGQYSKADVRILNHVTESFEWKKQLIQSAESSIELSANFAGGENFREILRLIDQRMEEKPNLRVHLILSRDLIESLDVQILEELSKKFNNRFVFLITDRIFCTAPFIHTEENHVKLLVVDGKYFITGGTGIHQKMTREEYRADPDSDKKDTFASNFIDRAFRDTDLLGQGPVACTMRQQFFSLFTKWEKRMQDQDNNRFFSLEGFDTGVCSLFHSQASLFTNVNLKCLVGGPEHRKSNPITNEITERIATANKSIRIANLIFNPADSIKKALQAKKDEKNIEIIGYLNGTSRHSSLGHYLYALPNRYNYDLLNTTYEYQKVNQLYHKKVATFDSQYTIIGSYNLGIKSAYCDDEIICVLDDTRIAEAVNATLDIDKSESIELKGKHLIKKRTRMRGALTIAALGPFFG